jgi:acetylglutamate kinase
MKRPWIIKAGGELMGSPAIQKKIVADLKRLSRSHPIVFVHGGGPQIEQDLVKNKIPVRFVNGRRFTSDAGMIVIEKVLSGFGVAILSTPKGLLTNEEARKHDVGGELICEVY